MMRVPFQGPINIYCDNEAVISNTTTTLAESTLNEEEASFYHLLPQITLIKAPFEYDMNLLIQILLICVPTFWEQ